MFRSWSLDCRSGAYHKKDQYNKIRNPQWVTLGGKSVIAHKTLIPMICLLCTVLAYTAYAESEESTAAFTFGTIEILKAGEQEWRFLEKGMVLAVDDLVRMPPFSLLRLKIADDTRLPTLSGGREAFVGTLINEGLQRRDAQKGKRINEDFDADPATDVLPVGNKPKTRNRASAFERLPTMKVSQSELETLRHKIDLLPDEIVSLVSPLLINPVGENVENPAYPAPNLGLARKIYGILNAIEVEVSLRPLLYAQLLRHAGLDVDLDANQKGQLFVIFDSEVLSSNAKQIAANQQLIHEKNGEDTVWIAVQIQSSRQNFTTAWYQGSQQ